MTYVATVTKTSHPLVYKAMRRLVLKRDLIFTIYNWDEEKLDKVEEDTKNGIDTPPERINYSLEIAARASDDAPSARAD